MMMDSCNQFKSQQVQKKLKLNTELQLPTIVSIPDLGGKGCINPNSALGVEESPSI
jgi:hypothetical protein